MRTQSFYCSLVPWRFFNRLGRKHLPIVFITIIILFIALGKYPRPALRTIPKVAGRTLSRWPGLGVGKLQEDVKRRLDALERATGGLNVVLRTRKTQEQEQVFTKRQHALSLQSVNVANESILSSRKPSVSEVEGPVGQQRHASSEVIHSTQHGKPASQGTEPWKKTSEKQKPHLENMSAEQKEPQQASQITLITHLKRTSAKSQKVEQDVGSMHTSSGTSSSQTTGALKGKIKKNWKKWNVLLPLVAQVSPNTNRGDKPPVCVSEISLTASCQGVGFGGMVLSSLHQIAVCDRLRIPVAVRWIGCTPYCGPANGTNYWEWFFEKTQNATEKYVEDHGAICFGDTPLDPHEITELVDHAFQPQEEEEGFHGGRRPPKITATIRKNAHRVINQYLRPVPEVMRNVDEYQARHFAGRTVVGVHVRGTDRWGEVRVHRIMEVKSWIRKIEELLNTIKERRSEHLKGNESQERLRLALFVASDNTEAIRNIRAHFGPRNLEVLSAKVWRTKSMKATSWDDGIADDQGRVAGLGVLTDILLLSRCHYLIHGESSVAALAAYFNPDLELVYASVSEAARWQRQHRPNRAELGRILSGGFHRVPEQGQPSHPEPPHLPRRTLLQHEQEEGENRSEDTQRVDEVEEGDLLSQVKSLMKKYGDSEETPDEAPQVDLDRMRCLKRTAPFSMCKVWQNFRQLVPPEINATMNGLCGKFCAPGDSWGKLYKDKLWSR